MQASLQRLQIPKLALYQIHFPAATLNFFANSAFLRGLAHCQQNGLTDAIGVSNFNEERLRHAHQTLQVDLKTLFALLCGQHVYCCYTLVQTAMQGSKALHPEVHCMHPFMHLFFALCMHVLYAPLLCSPASCVCTLIVKHTCS